MTGGWGALISGLTIGSTTILSVGPTNLLMMREGLMRGRVGTVAAAVLMTDVLLLGAAYLLADELARVDGSCRGVLVRLGVAALTAFAARSIGSAGRALLRPTPQGGAATLMPANTFRVLVIIWLNPLTYVETLLLPSALCEGFDRAVHRLLFVSGFMIMATLGCLIYSYGGWMLGRAVQSRRTVHVFDLLSGLLLAGLATSVAWSRP